MVFFKRKKKAETPTKKLSAPQAEKAPETRALTARVLTAEGWRRRAAKQERN